MRRAAQPSALPICGLSVVVTLLLTLCALPAASETEKVETLWINLATAQPSTSDEPVDVGIKKVAIFNLAPRFLDSRSPASAYVVKIVHETTPVPPFDYSAVAGDQAKVKARRQAGEKVTPEKCDIHLKVLREAKDLAAARALLELSPTAPEECKNAINELLRDKLAAELLGARDEETAASLVESNKDLLETGTPPTLISRRMTLDPYGPYSLRRGETLTVTIERGVGETHRMWTRRYVAPAAQSFLITYGLNFIPKNDHAYYAKTVPSSPAATQPYVLTEKAAAGGFDYAPSVFFSYPFPISKDQILALGPAAGLGFDLSAPIVFLGLAVIFNQNIHLVSGAVMQQQERLRGEYAVGQPLTEDLANDQLTQKTYQPNWFVGLSFRFSSNPFTSSTGPRKVTTPEPTPAPEP